MPRCSVVAFGVLALTIMTDSCWAQGGGAQGTVSGVVNCRERMALPPDAAIDVRLEDTSLQGAPLQANIMLQQMTGAATGKRPGPKLHGTYWRLIALNGKRAVPGMGQTQPYIRLHREQGAIEGSSGCNGVTGTYIAEQGALRINPAVATLMMCPPALMEQEKGLITALKATSSYKIEGNILQLSNGAEVVARFQAVPED